MRKHQKPKRYIFVVSGPSGSGKTTLLSQLLKNRKLRKSLAKSVSLTTRPKRSGERQGRDYFFISQVQFRRLLREKKILEWTRYLGYYYGTPKEFVEGNFRKGRHVILCLDFKGAKSVKRLYPGNTVTIFINPPSLGVLKQRIEGRCSRTKKEEIQKRLSLARSEVDAARKYDHCLVNKDLAKAVSGLRSIILEKVNTAEAR